MKEYFDMIFKRKSVRSFDSQLKLTEGELCDIKEKIKTLIPLKDGISVDYKILPRSETNAKWGEYCLLFYSEEKDNYLQNAGYMLQQLDLYLASMDIGGCWYGWGKTKETVSDMSFVIMYAFGKSRPEDFRDDNKSEKRRALTDMWKGNLALDAAEAARFAPSACNTQPWHAICGEDEIKLYRTTNARAMQVGKLRSYFNRIDIGIYMCILECALEHYNYAFKRELIAEEKTTGKIPTAIYRLVK